MKIKTYLPIIGIVILGPLASSPAWAGGGSSSDIGNLPDTLMQNLGYVADIMQTLSILIGLGLFIGGVFRLKRYGEMRTMMSAQMTMMGPLMAVLSGVAMLCSPLFMGTVLVSFWGTGGVTDLPYDGNTGTGWAQYIEPVLMLVRLVGVYAFMRGFVLCARTGGGQASPGTVGKVFIHLFGGILCVHIMGTMHLIESILGFNFDI